MIELLRRLMRPAKKGVADLRVALVSDALTLECLEQAVHVLPVTPNNYRMLFKFGRPDILLVESAWQGWNNRWKFGIAAYPDHPTRHNQTLQKMVAHARDLGIPTVFWNKEDGVHFDRFIDSAKLFEHIFTVDENCLPRYRALVPAAVTVNSLMFPVQPVIHHFSGFHFKYFRANFVGSYSHHIHDRRRHWQDMFFGATADSGLGLTVLDRNSDRKAEHYRFPPIAGIEVLPAVPHAQTAQIYRDYLVSINVNTVEDSPTMFSRRLVEILACGGIAVSNSSPAVERHFRDYCHLVENGAQARELFARLRHGPSADDLARAEAGSRYVLAEHTWAQRLAEITRVAGLR